MAVLYDPIIQKVLVQKLKIARNFWDRTVGLLGRKSIGENEGLLIFQCASIHTFFMRFAIDVVFIESNMVVKKIVHKIRPWRIAMCKGAFYALELPAGKAEQLGIYVGQVLAFSELDENPVGE